MKILKIISFLLCVNCHGLDIETSEIHNIESKINEDTDSLNFVINSPVSWSDFSKILHNAYARNITKFYISKNSKKIDISSNFIENEFRVALPNASKKNRNLFIFKIDKVESEKSGEFLYVVWSLEENDISCLDFFCRRISRIKSNKIALNLAPKINFDISDLFNIIEYIQNNIGDKKIIGIMFSME